MLRAAVARLDPAALARFEADWTAATARARDEYSLLPARYFVEHWFSWVAVERWPALATRLRAHRRRVAGPCAAPGGGGRDSHRVSDWTCRFVPNASSVVSGLTQAQVDEVENLASRIADAVAVRRIGTSFDVRETVSSLKSYGEGPVMIWFLEDYRDDVVLAVRVQHLGLPAA